MTNYHKIATAVIRISALTFILSSILDVGIVMTGILLISLEIIPRDAFAHEIYLIQSVFWLIGGGILFARSKSLATYVLDGLDEEKKIGEAKSQ